MNKLRLHLAGERPGEADDPINQIAEMALPLEGSGDLDPLIERIGDAHYVLLGEASHGTTEYYLSRARITQRLIREKGFSFIAVAGDWPDCYRINRYVRNRPGFGANAAEVLHAFARWPPGCGPTGKSSLWPSGTGASTRNVRTSGRSASMVWMSTAFWVSLDAVQDYLERIDPDAAAAARRAFRCFEPFGEDAQAYARATALVPASCESEVVTMLTELRQNAPAYREDSREGYFNAEQNAYVVRNAERYYRTMIRGDAASWNIRDLHMADTLDRLVRHLGPDTRAVVWEHNTHVGDARATDMAPAGMLNAGQVARQRHGTDDVVLMGFGTHRGSVIAGATWGAPMQRMTVPPAREGTWEDLLHQAGAENKLLIFRDGEKTLGRPRGHRAIGVVYEPALERLGNYVPTVLPERCDAFLYLDETQALHPLHIRSEADGEPPETYPWNV